MLGIFSGAIVSLPEELVAAGSRTPSPKTTGATLVNKFVQKNPSAVSVQVGDYVQLAYTHHKESPLRPRCIVDGTLVVCVIVVVVRCVLDGTLVVRGSVVVVGSVVVKALVASL
uniref:DUF3700 domain-containing protein n=1 Tax=Brassica campestris TaxID=3711 RepID=M4E4K3_BRACM